MNTPARITMDEQSASSAQPPASASAGKRVLKITLGLLVLAGLAALAIHYEVPAKVNGLMKMTLEWVKSLGIWGPILFILIYIVATVLFVPGSVLTLGAGAVFGVAWGSLYVSIAATLGATAAFLVGRHLARGWVARRIEGNPTFESIDKAVAREGWKIVGLTRLSPVFPFSLLNYALGLTQVSLRHYFLASWIGMIPGTIMYVYIGSLASAGATEATTGQHVLRMVGLVATIVVTVVITRIARRALAERLPAKDNDKAAQGSPNS